jgi:hypothetical protein
MNAYTVPELEIIAFETADVITASIEPGEDEMGVLI